MDAAGGTRDAADSGGAGGGRQRGARCQGRGPGRDPCGRGAAVSRRAAGSAAQPRRLPGADVLLWRAGVVTVPVAAVLSTLVIPFGDTAVADLSVGVVWFNAMEVLTWAGLWLAGWGPNAAFLPGRRLPLPGAGAGVRTAADVRADLGRHRGAVPAGGRHRRRTARPVVRGVDAASPSSSTWRECSPSASWARSPTRPAGTSPAAFWARPRESDRLLLQAGRWLWLAAGAAMTVPLFLGGGAGPVLPAWVWSLVKTLLVLAVLVLAGAPAAGDPRGPVRGVRLGGAHPADDRAGAGPGPGGPEPMTSEGITS